MRVMLPIFFLWLASTGCQAQTCALEYLSANPPSLLACQGDCDQDNECPTGETCIQRNNGNPSSVMNCLVGDSQDTAATRSSDYCSNSQGRQCPTSTATVTTTTSSSLTTTATTAAPAPNPTKAAAPSPTTSALAGGGAQAQTTTGASGAGGGGAGAALASSSTGVPTGTTALAAGLATNSSTETPAETEEEGTYWGMSFTELLAVGISAAVLFCCLLNLIVCRCVAQYNKRKEKKNNTDEDVGEEVDMSDVPVLENELSKQELEAVAAGNEQTSNQWNFNVQCCK